MQVEHAIFFLGFRLTASNSFSSLCNIYSLRRWRKCILKMQHSWRMGDRLSFLVVLILFVQHLILAVQAAHHTSFCHKGWCHEQNINTGTPTWKIRTPRDDPRRAVSDYAAKNKTLLPLRFEPLPLGSVRPLGWLGQQMDLMANGLPGHLHEFYRLVKNATWLGGEEEYSCRCPQFPETLFHPANFFQGSMKHGHITTTLWSLWHGPPTMHDSNITYLKSQTGSLSTSTQMDGLDPKRIFLGGISGAGIPCSLGLCNLSKPNQNWVNQ